MEQRNNTFETLADTVELMLSPDWKDRLRAEYYQTLIRYSKLKGAIDSGAIRNWGCDEKVYTKQANAMVEYLKALTTRIIYYEINDGNFLTDRVKGGDLFGDQASSPEGRSPAEADG